MKRTPEEDILRREAYALRTKEYQESLDKMNSADSLSPKSQAWRTKRLAMAERDLAEAKRFREQAQERLLAPPGNNLSGQRLLGEAFCINRLEEICQFAGNSKLKDFTDGYERDVCEEEISRLFRRFRCENVEGDPPYFFVSASMMGRLTHTGYPEKVLCT